MTTVWRCRACGWRGARVVVHGHGRRRSVERPEACGRCAGSSPLDLQPPAPHVRVSHRCACGTWFEAGRYATQCLPCRGQQASARAWATRGKTYNWTPDREAVLRARYNSRVRGRVAEIASTLGWPGWAIKKRAVALGLATKVMHRHTWTPAELDVLEAWTGMRSSRWIARRLTRTFHQPFSELAVVNKQKRLGYARRVRGEGMTLEDLELALGTDHRVIVRWVTEGKLRGRRRAGLGEHARYEFTDADLLACFRAHRTLVRLDQVDAEWFLGLVLPPRASRDEGAHPVRSA